MPTTEKEINNYLFDQLFIIERLEEVVASGNIEAIKKQLATERKQVERKLYQNSPIIDN